MEKKETVYSQNREVILAKAQLARTEKKSKLLKNKGFPQTFLKYGRINEMNVTVVFKTISEFKDFITMKHKKMREQFEEDDKELIFKTYKASKRLETKRKLLKERGFPEILSLWGRTNSETVSLSFGVPDDFYKFLSIQTYLQDSLQSVELPLEVPTPNMDLIKDKPVAGPLRANGTIAPNIEMPIPDWILKATPQNKIKPIPIKVENPTPK